jgi:hypothetical protein
MTPWRDFAMASRGATLWHLCQCFRGLRPRSADWTSLISLANQTLTTPALQDVVEQFGDDIPEEVSGYIGELFARNLARNDRLAEQLAEALAALNARGIMPMLLKGSAMLATTPRMTMGRRLISDLDIVVSPDEVEPAYDCLFGLGYRASYEAPDGDAKWYVDLARPGDVGMIDLQRGPPGHRFFYSASGDARQHCRLLEQGSAYIPSATYHALMLIIHDQFQDSDYWVGKTDLRHLLDLRDLADAPDGIDWNLLVSLAPGRLARNAIETQLITLSALLGVSVPQPLRRRLLPHLQYRRRKLQARMPVLGPLLLPLVLLDYRNYRAEVGFEERRSRRLTSRSWTVRRLETARFLFALSREQRAGKV